MHSHLVLMGGAGHLKSFALWPRREWVRLDMDMPDRTCSRPAMNVFIVF